MGVKSQKRSSVLAVPGVGSSCCGDRSRPTLEDYCILWKLYYWVWTGQNYPCSWPQWLVKGGFILQCADMRPCWNYFPTNSKTLTLAIRVVYSFHGAAYKIENDFLTVLEAEKFKSVCQNHLPLKALGKKSFFLPSFWWLPEILGILWFVAMSFQPLCLSS